MLQRSFVNERHMEFTQISNGLVTAKINHKGAELSSLYNNALQLEYMWQADPRFWPKSSPVLFPIVGALKHGKFVYDGKEYELPRHGIAREHVFQVGDRSPSSVTFMLRHNAGTLKVFPFHFEFRIMYELDGFVLKVSYEVINVSDSGKMLFSVGGHPAFKIPLIDGTKYEDYYLKFEKKESVGRWPVMPDGLIGSPPQPLLNNEGTLPLTHELFYEDALVFKDLASEKISIRSSRHTHGIDFSFPGFPFFGIWAFKDADFVCLEPWCGIADGVNHDQRFENKEGIIELAPSESWARTWTVTCY
jgi:galactose mutarotase-like enzyme